MRRIARFGVRKVCFIQKTEFNNLTLEIPMKINSECLSEEVAQDYTGNWDFQGKKNIQKK